MQPVHIQQLPESRRWSTRTARALRLCGLPQPSQRRGGCDRFATTISNTPPRSQGPLPATPDQGKPTFYRRPTAVPIGRREHSSEWLKLTPREAMPALYGVGFGPWDNEMPCMSRTFIIVRRLRRVGRATARATGVPCLHATQRPRGCGMQSVRDTTLR